MKRIPTIIRSPRDNSITISYAQPKATLIWLHGLGDTSEGFLSFFSHSSSPLYNGYRIKLLQAPERIMTIANGYNFNSWYDITSSNRFHGE